MHRAALPVAVFVRLDLVKIGVRVDYLVHAAFVAQGQGCGQTLQAVPNTVVSDSTGEPVRASGY
jgi:hypothetical protein